MEKEFISHSMAMNEEQIFYIAFIHAKSLPISQKFCTQTGKMKSCLSERDYEKLDPVCRCAPLLSVWLVQPNMFA